MSAYKDYPVHRVGSLISFPQIGEIVHPTIGRSLFFIYLLHMIAMPPLIPTTQWTELSLAIARGNTDQVRRLVEENQIDVNAFLDANNWMPLLMEALLSYGFDTEEERLTLLHYLLEKGANPNQYSKKGYNCVHIAVQQERYWPALELFLDYGADVNAVDADGSTVAYWAIQVSLLRKGEEADRAVAMRILKKILLLGPNLDQTNRFGMSARGWLEYAPDDLKSLIARWEAGKPAIRPSFTVAGRFPDDPSSADSEKAIVTNPRQSVVDRLFRVFRRKSDPVHA